MADLLDFAGVRAFTSNAGAGAGYIARFYQSGTTTPVTVYTSSDLGTAHGTSVTADASGVFPAVWAASGSVKCTIETPAGAVVQTIDPVFSYSSDTTGASGVSFEPTVDLPYTNVQDAIEGAAASAASGFATYGIGITGNATLLANIDATDIGAGVYRFDGTTTGTLPTGVAAADTGLVEHWRQSASTAMQFLFHATTDRVFHRRMASTAWGTWREVITSNQAPAQGDLLYRAASAWTRLAKGAVDQALYMNAGLTAPEWSTAYRCRAWVNFNGTGVVAIRGSGNVSSITDNGTGDYTINFTTAMADANYGFAGMTQGFTNHPQAAIAINASVAPTASAIRVATGNTGGNGSVGQSNDMAWNSVVIFR